MWSEKRGSGVSRIYGRERGSILTALVAGTHGMRYMAREPLYRTGAWEGVSRAALGALTCLLLTRWRVCRAHTHKKIALGASVGWV